MVKIIKDNTNPAPSCLEGGTNWKENKEGKEIRNKY